MLGLGLSVTQLAARGLRLTDLAAAIRALFAAGEQGVWYDPSDLTTLYQDAAGTTPVTAVEQPVGLMLDKSKGLVLGPERSGGLETGALSLAAFAADSGETLPAGVKTLQFTVVISSYTSGSITIGVGAQSISANRALTLTGVGAFTAVYTIPASETLIAYRAGAGGFVGTIDNISVRELPGNHAYQTTSTSRPVLSARVNLLTATETLATQTVNTRATTQTLRFEGAGTVTLSGTATGTYSAGSHSVTTTAGNLTLTVSGTVTKADLRAANMGVGLPAYQRVNTATDYDTVGFPHYLRFDGVDDFLVTNSINFTAADKMTVFAGVRKLSDASLGCVAGTFSSGSAGGFELLAPRVGPGEKYGFLSSGTIPAVAITSNAAFNAPATNVLTGIGNISGDQAILRANGVQVGSSTDNQGTGNYGNYSLYLGVRPGSAFPFAGHLYGLLVRGAQSTAQQIIDAETYINSKTKAYA